MTNNIENVGIIGAGILGTQIALLSAYAGQKVRIFDPVEGAFAVTYGIIYKDLQAKKVEPLIPWDQWPVCKDRIEQLSDLAEAVKDADLVIEAVLENLELKKKVFNEIGRHSPAEAILATSSSSLPVSKMAVASGRPERCMNIHFYFPLRGVNIADIMGSSQTLPAMMAKGEKWIRSLGCIPLRVKKETSGFCFSGVWKVIERQALYLWGNDLVDFRDIDRAWMIFTGMKEGPFGLMDQVGLDSVYDIEMVYYRESNNTNDKPPEGLRDKIKRGELGIKSGKGFYSYPKPEFLRPDFLNPP
ncbi:MAG: 3-hydroxyacyl-CoA dehydrogenase NAD-binding domain-containing protein [Syntrophales bacterium]|nr:3-hydroxyacyl-CoA dehydrogenase NAD-binding domain-containing protein [Syntrophales bacterium]